MSKKYDYSFETQDELPSECPICGHEFDMDEDIDISPYKGGFRSMLECPKCNYKKELSYLTEEDCEKQMNEDNDYEEDD